MNWVEVEFQKLVNFYNHIRVPLSGMEREKRQGSYRYYGAQNIIDYVDDYLFDGEYVLIAEDGANLMTRNAPIAQIVDGQFWVNNHAHIVKAKEGVSTNRFINYLINNNNLSGYITGAAQPKLSQKNLKIIKFKVPPYKYQVAIDDLLSNYDNLIENNKRRIALLEESARQLYKEWFVRFRFPGHEHVKIVNGVPEGWKSIKADDVVDILSGGTPKTSVPEFWNGGIPFFTPKDATSSVYASYTEKTLSSKGLDNCSSKLYPKNTLFITARGTVGKLNLAQRPMAMNQSCYALAGKENINQVFLFFAMQAGIQQVKSRAVGAVFDAIIKDTFKLIPFVLPPKALIDQFTDFTTPVLNQIDTLLTSNTKLTAARDTLLPKLMSGELAV
ncbi:restriction endonuclease subunit S [Pseudidiomarina sp. E22-M8]|uniref:restriction endonuclease subunit S n=1 Tax=Pseudidiomarina sp. E22-M8 TaxID=3424768 RepID=UPI00403CDB89